MHTGQGPDRDAEKVNSAVQLDRPCLVGEILTSTISVNAEWQRVSSIIIVRSSAAVFFPFEATVLVSPALSEERRYARGWLPDRSPDQHRGVQIIYPDRCNRLDYEGEIAIVLGKRGVDLTVRGSAADSALPGPGVGLSGAIRSAVIASFA